MIEWINEKNNKTYTLVGVIVILILIGYFLYSWCTRGDIRFYTRTPTVEVHHEFESMSIIKSVVNGNIEDVEIDDSKLNKEIVGKYPVLYKYNNKEITIVVSVVDTQPPTFELINIEIDLGMSVDPADMVVDLQDASDTKIYFKKAYDFSKVGDVEVLVVVEDEYGNKDEKKAMVHVLEEHKEAPDIQGIKDLTVRLGDINFDYFKDITVIDTRDPNPTITVDVENVNIHEVGDYEITYTARNRAGNIASAICKVSVVENKPIGTLEQSDEKIVYLTFDDGPSELTEEVLDILDQYDITATFFVTGLNPNYFHLIKEAEQRGHTIGLHTYSHNYSEIYSSVDAYYHDLNRIAELCLQQIGYVPVYIRFPGGSSNTVSKRYKPGIMSYLIEDVIAKGYQYYDWNANSGDGSGTLDVVDITTYATLSNANNIVLLFHDANGKHTTVEALPGIIQHYQSLGYRFAGIDDDSYVPHHAVNN